MKSKTKIGKQIRKKSNSELAETIILAKKSQGWIRVAEVLSGPRRKLLSINLGELNEEVGEGENIVVVGKILSQGELTKKAKVSALNFSAAAKDKLLKQKIEINYISDEIKKNPSAKGLKILTHKK